MTWRRCPRRSRQRQLTSRRGVSLIEMLIAMALIAMLAAIITPSVLRRQVDGEAASVAQSLSAIRNALFDFRKAIGRYPSQIAHLSTLPVAGATDLCARNVPIDWDAAWRGPYLARTVGTSGLPAGNGTILNAIRRDPATLPGGTLANMFLDVVNIDQKIAVIVEASFDPSTDFTTGTIRWASTAGELGTLSMAIPIRGC